MDAIEDVVAAARRWSTAAADRVSELHGTLRLLVAAPAVLAAGLVGLVCAVLAGIAVTGCGFVNCGEPQPLRGVLLLLPTGASPVVMVAALTWAMSPERARAVALRTYAWGTLAVAAATGVLVGHDSGSTGNAVAGLSLLVLTLVVALARRRLAAVPMAFVHATEDLPRRVRTALVWLVVVADLVWVLFVAATSTCGFAGGRCPDPAPVPLLDREGLWLAGGWTLAAGLVVVLLTGRRRDPVAWLAVAVAAVAGGLIGA